MNTTQSTTQCLSDTQWYQGILHSLTTLDHLVQLDPQEFADDHLREIEDKLSKILAMVAEGII